MFSSSASKRTHPEDQECFSSNVSEFSDFSDFARCLSSAGSEEDFEVIAQLEKASLEEKKEKKGAAEQAEEDYVPVQKKVCNEILEEVRAIRAQLADPKPENTIINQLRDEVSELRYENKKLQEENSKLKKDLPAKKKADLPIKHTIVGGWHMVSSKTLKLFLHKMRLNSCDDLEISLFEKGQPHFYFEGDVLSSYTRYGDQTYDAYSSTLGEVHRMFGYTRETFIDDNVMYRIDTNAYKKQEMMKEKLYIENDLLHIVIERFGETCTRVYKKNEAENVVGMKRAITGRWKLVESNDDDPANIGKRIDSYTWEGNTFTRNITGAGRSDLVFSKTLGIPQINQIVENLTYVEGDRIITTFKRVDTQVEHFRTERYVRDHMLYVVHHNRKTATKTVSIYKKL